MGLAAMLVTISNVLYQIVFFTRRLVRQRNVPLHTLAIFASWTILGASALADFGWWLGWGELWGGLHGAYLGIAILAVLQSAALAHEHMRSLKTSDALNVELAGRVDQLVQRNAEVDDLNVELRRQIASRSQQLSDLLAREGHGAGSNAPLSAGDIVGGRYRIERAIGQGGMGAVYEVRRTKDERRFALKVLHGQTGSGAMARFAREAQLASLIDHPSIVSVVDVDVTTDGTLFLVMEYVDGPSLESERTRFGDVAWAKPLLAQIASGLAAIHAKGIVHRDLKPANVLLAYRPDAGSLAKIADFGISTLARDFSWNSDTVSARGVGADDTALARNDAASPALTQTGMIMGTPMYMAPEMFVSARNARPAADVFSFGVIANELLAGRYPFPEGSVLARVQRRSTRPLPSIATLVPSLGETLADCLDRCLSTEPTARPTAEDLVAALA
jgi:serine/threonine-protein kinase